MERTGIKVSLALATIALVAGIALGLRLQVIAPWRISDSALNPPLAEGALVWIRHDAGARQRTPSTGCPILVQEKTLSQVLRRWAGASGDTLVFDGQGTLRVGSWEHHWEEDPWIVEPLRLRLPSPGDTLYPDSLSPAAFDMLRLYLHHLGWDSLEIRTTVTIDNRPIDPSRLNSVSLYGRTLTPRHLNALSWQETRVVEMQLQGREHPSRRVRVQRQLWHLGEHLRDVAITDSVFFAVCDAPRCRDGRSSGYLPHKALRGIPLYPPSELTCTR